jgi:hypothetical protein
MKDSNMNTIADILQKSLKVKSCKTMIFGATLVDTNPAAGRQANIDSIKKPQVWSPINSLLLYPSIKEYEKNNEKTNGNIDLSMTSCWMTAFTPLRRGMSDMTKMTANSKNFLEGRSVSTTEQFFSSRPDDLLAAMFTHMRWYNTDERFVDKNLVKNNDKVGMFIKRGQISKSWENDPVQVRYFIRIMEGSDTVYDSLYLVGGSTDVIGDKLDEIPSNIASWYDQIKNLKEEIRKSAKASKGDDDESSQSTPSFLWHAWEGENKSPVIRANILGKKILRTIESIVLIYNSLVYARDGVGVTEIDEVVGYDDKKKEPIFKTVELAEVIKKYDTIYAYCKNLCYIFKDIGAGDIM